MYRKSFILLIIFISSCTGGEELKTKTQFFDIKGFFEAEAKRLSNKKSHVDKSVIQNNQAEVKKKLAVDWDNELALFIASDINKPAWIDSYKVVGDGVRVTYLAIDTNLRTRFVEILKDKQGKAVYFKIKNYTRSKLYESSEELSYFPDSIYKINKNQTVLFLGSNTYQIIGKILK